MAKKRVRQDEAASAAPRPARDPSANRKSKGVKADVAASNGGDRTSSPYPLGGALIAVGTYNGVLAGLVLPSRSKLHVQQQQQAAAEAHSSRPAGRLLLKFSTKHHTGPLSAIAMTDKYLASSSAGDERIFLYTIKDNYTSVAELGSLNPASEVRCLCFPLAAPAQHDQSPAEQGQSKYLLCGCADGTLAVYNTRTWECDHLLPVHGGFDLEQKVKQNIQRHQRKLKGDKKVMAAVDEEEQLESLHQDGESSIAAMAVWSAPTGSTLVITAGARDRRVAVVDMSTATVVTKFKLPSVKLGEGRQQHFERATWNAIAVDIALRDEARPQAQCFAVLCPYDLWIYKLATMELVGRFSTRPRDTPEGFTPIPSPENELTTVAFVSESVFICGSESGALYWGSTETFSGTNGGEEEAACRYLTDQSVRCVVDTSGETDSTRAARIGSLFRSNGHAKRIKAVNVLHRQSGKLHRTRQTTIVTADSAGVVAAWGLDLSEAAPCLTELAMAHCEGRIMTAASALR